jgi:hypothetical protein
MWKSWTKNPPQWAQQVLFIYKGKDDVRTGGPVLGHRNAKGHAVSIENGIVVGQEAFQIIWAEVPHPTPEEFAMLREEP